MSAHMAKRKRGKRAGRDLEVLVASIEKSLALDSSNIKVESPVRLRDKVTGVPREHDVLITWTQAHHEILIAVECRDKKKKIGSGDVEAFHTKCQDTGINQGIMVSSSGFTKPALEKAKAKGIRCLTLQQALQFNWLQASGIKTERRKVLGVQWTFTPADKSRNLRQAFQVVSAETGEIIPSGNLVATAIEALNSLDPKDLASHGKSKKQIHCPNLEVKLRDPETNDLIEIESASVTVEYEVEQGFVPFDLVAYKDEESGTLASAAVADVEGVSPVKGKIVMINKEDGTDVVFVPESNTD